MEEVSEKTYTEEEIQALFEAEAKKVLFAFEDEMLAIEEEMREVNKEKA